ncbi:MAG: SDR family NAD(P)-dependent oxidoreductase [Planctomycetota bacterium]
MTISAESINRIALVTGASRGIGRAIALALAEQGVDVAVGYAGNRLAAENCAEAIAARGRRVCVAKADLGAADGAAGLVRQVRSQLGDPTILVCNASIQEPLALEQIDAAAFDRQMHCNLRSTLQLAQACVPAMRARGWGRILTVGSVQEARPHPDMLVYAASKCAQTSMTRNLAKQLAADGICVNNIAPGVICTDRNTERLADQAYAQQVRAAIPAGTFGSPEDCAAAAALLCSDAGRYITGQNLFIDGGLSLP